MSTFIAFSPYVSPEGKAERLSEHVGEYVTLTEYDGLPITGEITSVKYHEDEGWLAVLYFAPGAQPGEYVTAYVSDVVAIALHDRKGE